MTLTEQPTHSFIHGLAQSSVVCSPPSCIDEPFICCDRYWIDSYNSPDSDSPTRRGMTPVAAPLRPKQEPKSRIATGSRHRFGVNVDCLYARLSTSACRLTIVSETLMSSLSLIAVTGTRMPLNNAPANLAL
jgi:hypothetical protein